MKKLLIIFFMLCMLTACSGEEMLETVQDVYVPMEETPMQISVTLPRDTAVQTLSSDGGRLYICDGFVITIQTLQGGDIARTVKETTGYALDRLTLMETEKNDVTCYRFSWVTAGEGGDQTARTVILDDGRFHYAVTVMAPAEQAGALTDTIQAILASVSLHTAP